MKDEKKIEATSLPFWSWNDELNAEKLKAQIRWMHQQSFGGFFMHARAGLSTEYLSDEWFRCVKVCCDEAKKLGMKPWLYDENGWPSGFVGGKLLGNKAFREHYLQAKTGGFDEDAAWRYQIVGGELRFAQTPCDGEFLNVYDRESVSTVDVLNDEVVDAFLKETHEKYRGNFGGRLSEYIEGFFTDEPQYYRGGTPYPKKLRAYFQEKYGEDPVEKLGLLFVKKKGYRTFRYRYWKCCQELFLNNFAKKVYGWCDENGVKLTGHYVEERDLFAQMLFNAGIMPYYEYLHYPGIDWLCRRYMPVFCVRQLTSVTEQLQKPMAMSEMFAMTGWDVTPRELKSIADYQYVYGINLTCQHLLPYSEKGERKRDHPAHFSAYNPWVDRGMGAFNRYFDALGAWIRKGKETVNVAVLHTVRSAYFDYQYNSPQSVASLDESLIQTCEELAEHHVAFHLIDETLLEKYGDANDGKLRLGACEYDTFILPFAHTMDKATEKILQKYVLSGGKVLLRGDAPKYLEGEPFDYSYLKSNITFETICKSGGYSVESDGKLHTSLRVVDGEKFVFAVNISDDAVRAKIACDGTVFAGEYDVETEVRSFVGEYVEFSPKSSKILCRWEDALPPKEETETIMLGSGDYKVVDFSDNYFALDFARLSYDGVHYGEPLPVAGIFQKLLAERYDGEAYLKTTFTVHEKPKVFKLAAEDPKNVQVTLNGKELVFGHKFGGKENFYEADISFAAKTGENELIARYRFRQNESVYFALFGDGVTEGLRNCMRYDMTVETMYLSGKFGVYAENFRKGTGKNIFLADGFYIGETPKTARNFITDGFPFFAGNLCVRKEFTCSGGKTRLVCKGRYHHVDVTVNGKYAGVLSFDDSLDISAFVLKGKNAVEFTLYTGNRNMLGPHHLKSCEENTSVSPYSFDLFGTWEDGKSKEFTDVYSFVRFGFFENE